MQYRNKIDIMSDQGVEIDVGSLWELNEETFVMTLIDEDQYITANHTIEEFEYAIKEYLIEIINIPDVTIILKGLEKDIIAFSFNGYYKEETKRFQFKTILDFSELFIKIGKLGLEKFTLQTLS